MKHCREHKSEFGLGKGGQRRSGVTALAVLITVALHGCSQTAEPKNGSEGEATSDPRGDDQDGKGSEPDVASHGQPTPVSKDSPAARETKHDNDNERASAPTAPISKSLPASFDCSGFICYRFAESRAALVPLLLHQKAQLIAFGEAHAPASFSGASTVRRFTQDLLPTISDGASHLLLELLNPPKEGCQKEKAAAQKESEKITAGQSKQNQNEYLTLGAATRKLGVVPDILWSSCEDLAFIASPEGGVVAMMETIAKLSEKTLKEQLRSTRPGRPLVLAYGGALHNDVAPREGREAWSYGPQMIDDTKGRYLEIDLVIPELISDSVSWKSFAWYDAYAALDHKEGAILMQWGERSFSLFLEPRR
jgi:hypothetical protein